MPANVSARLSCLIEAATSIFRSLFSTVPIVKPMTFGTVLSLPVTMRPSETTDSLGATTQPAYSIKYQTLKNP